MQNSQKFFRKRLLNKQLNLLNGRIQELEVELASISRIRFLLFIGAFIISWVLFFWQGAIVWGAAFLPLFIPFGIYVAIYNRLNRGKERWQQWRDIKQKQLARMELDWSQLPYEEQGEPLQNHPFGLDLDLVGPRSLHHLINTAVTQEGSERLRQWLLTPLSDPEEIQHRQVLVRELEKRPLFRNKLILNSQTSLKEGRFPGNRLLDWLNNVQPQPQIISWILGLSGMTLITVLLLLFNQRLPIPNLWLVALFIDGFLYLRASNLYTQSIFQDATFMTNQLDTLNHVFNYLEKSSFKNAPNLKSLCAPFHDESNKPSENIRRIQRVMIGIGLRQNPLMGLLLNIVMPWDLIFAYLLQQRQLELKKELPKWLHIWNELEALGSLANLAHLNPDFISYPIISADQSAFFEAKDIAHPLIHDNSRVGNHFAVPKLGQVSIVTGSNMAGKSSFLRTLGLNLVLAYAGGPVFASSLKTSIFRLHSSIRVTDSLQDGFSFFYAEVQRLRSILNAYELEDKRPLFFLIDEIFRGTNNRERLIGSQSFIEVLASGKAIGLVATHDLELVKLADTFETIENYHFRDDVEEGKMVFDYTLRKGPCPTTNALKIMALAGLPVKTEGV